MLTTTVPIELQADLEPLLAQIFIQNLDLNIYGLSSGSFILKRVFFKESWY